MRGEREVCQKEKENAVKQLLKHWYWWLQRNFLCRDSVLMRWRLRCQANMFWGLNPPLSAEHINEKSGRKSFSTLPTTQPQLWPKRNTYALQMLFQQRGRISNPKKTAEHGLPYGQCPRSPHSPVWALWSTELGCRLQHSLEKEASEQAPFTAGSTVKKCVLMLTGFAICTWTAGLAKWDLGPRSSYH